MPAWPGEMEEEGTNFPLRPACMPCCLLPSLLPCLHSLLLLSPVSTCILQERRKEGRKGGRRRRRKPHISFCIPFRADTCTPYLCDYPSVPACLPLPYSLYYPSLPFFPAAMPFYLRPGTPHIHLPATFPLPILPIHTQQVPPQMGPNLLL